MDALVHSPFFRWRALLGRAAVRLLLPALLASLPACGRTAGGEPEAQSHSRAAAAPAAPDPVEGDLAKGPRPQPKPGERVRQPELDGYCPELARPEAFYYHGGRPVVRLARRDRCTPLFISDCAPGEACEQEPGMWCCGQRAVEQTQARR